MDKGMNKDSNFLKLNKAFYIKSKISNYPVSDLVVTNQQGLSIILFESKDDIEKYLQRRNATNFDEFEFIRVGSIYDRMREFASLGFVSFYFHNNFPVYFCNRFSEYNCELPTLGYCYLNEEDGRFYFGASGILSNHLKHTLWSDFSKSDQMLRRNVNFHSGFSIDPKDTFYAIHHKTTFQSDVFDGTQKLNHRIAFANGSPLRKPFLYSEGSTPVFSTIELAEKYFNQLTGEDRDSFRVVKVPHLIDYLSWLSLEYFPFPLDIGLNPNAHRMMQGYFFPNWYLRNIFGVFKISDDLSIEEISEQVIFIPDDNVNSSENIEPFILNLRTIVDLPLGRILRRTTSRLSRDEAQEVAKNEIESTEYRQGAWDKPIDLNKINADKYLIFAYDKISGNPFSNDGLEDTPYIFSDIFDACSFFYHQLFKFEYDIRLNGYAHEPSFVEGSNDEKLEDFILDEKKRGIKRLMEDILIEGYKPEHSVHLMNFINKHSPVLNVLTCGYLKDLSIYRDLIFEEAIVNLQKEDETSITKKLKKMYHSSRSKHRNKNMFSKEIRDRLNIWLGNSIQRLDFDSILMLESAISEFENAGKDESYDYAGISMKLCKVFERELRRSVFESWRTDHNLDLPLEFDRQDLTLKRISGWLNKTDKLDLGGMQFILNRTNENPNHAFLDSFREYLSKFPNYNYLLSEELQNDLAIMRTKYRNGGVHESIVTYDICEEALKKIIILPNSALIRLLSA